MELDMIYLEVHTQNKAAIKLYEKQGFTKSMQILGYYRNTRMKPPKDSFRYISPLNWISYLYVWMVTFHITPNTSNIAHNLVATKRELIMPYLILMINLCYLDWISTK